MTAGAGNNPIKSFKDVIDRGIRVVTRHSTSSHEFLRTASEGTPMHTYYFSSMHNNPNMFVKVRTEEFLATFKDCLVYVSSMYVSV